MSSALIAALVGFGGTIAFVVEAMHRLGASAAETGSAVTALCLGIALTGAALSLRLRIPVVLAWSTPGAALLAATAPGLSWPTAIGLFLAAVLMMIVVALIPLLGRLTARIPSAIASAMLAGALLPFCLNLFRLGGHDPLLFALLLAVFLIARQRVPLHALLLALGAGLALTLVRGDFGGLPLGPVVGTLKPVVPAFDTVAILSIGAPLFLVTLVSQNLPGLVALRGAGYTPEPTSVAARQGTGLAGRRAVRRAWRQSCRHHRRDLHQPRGPSRRREAMAGRPSLCRLLSAARPIRSAARPNLSGIASHRDRGAYRIGLIPALLGALETMFARQESRDPAILTFLATASGLTLLGLGSAFWGLAVGFAALGAASWFRRG